MCLDIYTMSCRHGFTVTTAFIRCIVIIVVGFVANISFRNCAKPHMRLRLLS